MIRGRRQVQQRAISLAVRHHKRTEHLRNTAAASITAWAADMPVGPGVAAWSDTRAAGLIEIMVSGTPRCAVSAAIRTHAALDHYGWLIYEAKRC